MSKKNKVLLTITSLAIVLLYGVVGAFESGTSTTASYILGGIASVWCILFAIANSNTITQKLPR